MTNILATRVSTISCSQMPSSCVGINATPTVSTIIAMCRLYQGFFSCANSTCLYQPKEVDFSDGVMIVEPSTSSFVNHTRHSLRPARPLIRTLPGSSKVLRKHFAELSVTPHCKKIQSGAVRLDSTCKKPKPRAVQPKIHSPSRIGYDGTTKTPSKELLQLTACSRSHQVPFQSHDYLHAHEHDEL